MGKKKRTNNKLGRAMQRDRFASKSKLHHGLDDEWLHTSQIDDGTDWARLNLHSVTERSSLEDFLSTAELAGTEFIAEKLNIKVIDANYGTRQNALESDEMSSVMAAQEERRKLLTIPRRPCWTTNMPASELHLKERESFLQWRKQLSELEADDRLTVTPFEKNLDIWRQLWRVLEKSHIVVQIVDARNPLLFRCEDLEHYVAEIDSLKVNLLLLNKADLLTHQQRLSWATYFKNMGIKIAFWSASLELEVAETEDKTAATTINNSDTASTDEDDDESKDRHSSTSVSDDETRDDKAANKATNLETVVDKESTLSVSEEYLSQDSEDAKVLNGSELLELFKSLHDDVKATEDATACKPTVVGLVGYPNVGKSSTINALFQSKKVAVSTTPGRTKHFQTLFLDQNLCLCDCPGLVYPSFVSTKAAMVTNGVYVCERIPRAILESIYGISLPLPREGEDPTRPPTPHELLNAYGYLRGYMTVHGQPDIARSSRYILKDFVNGKLLYCCPPPGFDPIMFQDQFNNYKVRKVKVEPKVMERMHGKKEDIDQDFFAEKLGRMHIKGRSLTNTKAKLTQSTITTDATHQANLPVDKPWKRHFNKNKKEKLRRIYDK